MTVLSENNGLKEGIGKGKRLASLDLYTSVALMLLAL